MGRANLARPLLCAVAAALVALATASAAQAALPAPVLTGTNPISPGAALSPRIQGQIDEGETKVVHLGVESSAFGGPIARAPEPTNTVKLYTEAGCLGPVVGEGTAEKLETEGISLTAPVAPDSVTTFFATQGNIGGTSECSTQGVTYRQVTTPPGPPSLESVTPASPANDNFPHLIGSADPEASVSIYTTSDCTGTALASGSGAAFAAGGIQVAVADNSEATFYARATMAGFASACSTSSITYKESTPSSGPGGGGGGSGGGGTTAPPGPPPPAPHLRTVPGGSANDNTPLITGSAPGATSVRVFASADCSGPAVAKGAASQFASPGLTVQVVDNVAAVFTAVSVAPDGQSDCSAPVLYVEDSLTPHTRITMGPAAKTAKHKAILRFVDTTGDAPGTIFRCKVDRHKWKQCASPLRLRGLRSNKSYLVQVKATDPAGNTEQKAAKRKFRVVPRP